MTAGQRISERGNAISDRGKAWTEGQRDQSEGQKLVKRSTDRIADGEKDLRNAQAAMDKAQGKIATAQTDRTRGEGLVSSGSASVSHQRLRENESFAPFGTETIAWLATGKAPLPPMNRWRW